jgi:hypothetical protein
MRGKLNIYYIYRGRTIKHEFTPDADPSECRLRKSTGGVSRIDSIFIVLFQTAQAARTASRAFPSRRGLFGLLGLCVFRDCACTCKAAADAAVQAIWSAWDTTPCVALGSLAAGKTSAADHGMGFAAEARETA